MTTVLICDDRRQVRDGLTRVMSRVSGVQRIEHSEYGELLRRYSRHRMDLVLVGTHRAATMGVESIRQLVSAQPQANVIAFGAPHDVDNIAAAIASGARGFLRWDSVPSDAVGRMPQAVGGTVALPAFEVELNGTEELRLTRAGDAGTSRHEQGPQQRPDLAAICSCRKTPSRHTPGDCSRKLGAHDQGRGCRPRSSATLLYLLTSDCLSARRGSHCNLSTYSSPPVLDTTPPRPHYPALGPSPAYEDAVRSAARRNLPDPLGRGDSLRSSSAR